jgi:hypothetical protein
VTYGGDSGNRIFVLYWRCPLIRVSVSKGSTVLLYHSYSRLIIRLLEFSDQLYPSVTLHSR